MPESNGWTGRILWVSLANRKFSIHPTLDDKEYIGGRRINPYLLLMEVPDHTAPLSLESRHDLRSGPLVGTSALASSRLGIDFKKESQMLEGHLKPDPVHMLISIPPRYSVAQGVELGLACPE